MKEGVDYCACGSEMRVEIAPKMELFDGIVLHDMPQTVCPRCGNTFLTEEQAEMVERTRNDIICQMFGIRRKVTYSGNCKSLHIPKEIVEFIGLSKGSQILFKPLDRRRVILEVV